MTDANPNPNPDPNAQPAGNEKPAGSGTPNPADAGKPAGNAAESTIVNPTAGEEGKQPVPADWPTDWRTKLAGDDKDLLKRLERFKSPQDVWTSFRALEQKVSSGELKKPSVLPDNATPEQLAEFRKENGIPEKPEGYDTTLPEGLVIGEDDKPIVDAFLKEMHAANAPGGIVKSALSTYFQLREQQRTAMVEADGATWKATEDALRAELGSEYRLHQNAISNYLETLPEGFRENLIGARLADGTKLLGSVDGIKLIMSMAKDANPAITVVPGSTNPAKSIEEELASIKIGSPEYWADPKKQARALELLSAQEKLQKKTA